MPTIVFAPQLRRHVDVPALSLAASSLREALECAFELHPRMRGYVLDEQGALRKHLMIFIDGVRVVDREGLSDALAEHSQVHVFQALTGG